MNDSAFNDNVFLPLSTMKDCPELRRDFVPSMVTFTELVKMLKTFKIKTK